MSSSTAIKALKACDKELRRALAEAATGGDFDALRQITVWAEEVRAMLTAAQAPDLPAKPAAASPGTARAADWRRMIQDEYPRFFRRGDELVKVGWSKSDGKEYNHRAPRRAVDAVITAVKRLTAQGEAFASEDINPLKDSEGGVYPTYQIFVVLAWLRRLGLIHQPGRKSNYSLVQGMPLDATVDAAWKTLDPWRG